MTKALGLFSGGLDSILAASLLMRQGIEVTALTFVTPFFGAHSSKKACDRLGIPLIVKDISEPHFEILKNPRFGYGKNFNPCMDCHMMMINVAGHIMEEEGFDFIFTGEVIGQRPFSQNKVSLYRIAKACGYAHKLLRPLSAKLLDETEMERSGLVDRERLLGINGRSRKPQFALAAEWGITEYAKTGGGCILTDPGFSQRLKEAFADTPNLTSNDIEILKFGRHFRLSEKTRLIVGKTQGDNNRILAIARPNDILAKVPVIPGPTAVFSARPDATEMIIAARIVSRYADTSEDKTCEVLMWSPDGSHEEVVAVIPFTREEADELMISIHKK